MIERLQKSPSLALFREVVQKEKSLLVEELWDAPLALLAAIALQATKQSVLLVTGGMREDRLFEDLSFFAPGAAVEFPAWETLPGEEILPSPDILGKRFEALYTLLERKSPSIVLCPLQALLQKVAPKKEIAPLLTMWRKGQTHPFDTLPAFLSSLGYRPSAVVSEKGEFARRGGILDLFPTAASNPLRIEFFGDKIEQIRTFDPVGQKSIERVEAFFLCPADELSLLKKAKNLTSILDYLSPKPLLIWDDLLAIEDAVVKLQQMPGARSSFFYRLEEFLKEKALFSSAQNIETLSETRGDKENIAFEAFGHPLSARRFLHAFRKTDDLSQLDPNLSFFFLGANEAEEEEIKRQLSPLPPKTHFEKGTLASGLCIADLSLALIPFSEVTHKARIRRQKWRGTAHTPAAEFHELLPGDLVVHFHSGIGRYLGMEKHANHLGVETEFLAIEYAEKSRLLVPLSQAYLVSRYIGTNEQFPSLSQLGSKRWQVTRANAAAQIVGYAKELLQLYATRAVQSGFRFPSDSALMQQFEMEFPYEETQDQRIAITAVKEDMMSEKTMDRLLCGDVGYGKTEVAMRAAFKAIIDGQKQVALLVPTTVLAMQHFETFSERMKGFPVRLGVISRFRSGKETSEILEKTRRGEIDLLIGTHRLLSKDVAFKDLGLLIIDEEQRFGVRAKEHLKKLKAGIDCLILSATPIPRTLYLSLVNARDMSVIHTPPQDRLPVKTILAEADPELIQNALLREFSRGGQAFYIHNRVESLFEKAKAIHELVPSARIGVVHGQMDADEIDTTFHRFKEGQIDLLFATTIVENGIDIPNANTILIERADTYGLADLYQMRGRVGRWNRTAYAYFLVPKKGHLLETSRKRLNALAEAGGYGGGMKIAMRDLEIRGAGNLLGVQQSGHVSSIGFHLYCKLLKRAINALKKKKNTPPSFEEVKMEFSLDASLPASYINEVSLRMEIYYRLGQAADAEEIDAILAELKDRFGPPPLPVLWLYHLSRIRTFAAQNHFSLLKFESAFFLAERQRGKTLERKTFPLPLKGLSPAKLETHVIEQLQRFSSLN